MPGLGYGIGPFYLTRDVLGRRQVRACRVYRVFFIGVDACGFPACCLAGGAICFTLGTGILATRLSALCPRFFLTATCARCVRRIGWSR
jgi:hypothetical protein